VGQAAGQRGGFAGDALRPNKVVGGASASLGLSCAVFALAGIDSLSQPAATAIAWTAMIILSLSQSLIFVGGTTLLARFYGRPHHGAIRSALTFFMVTGTSIGPVLTAALANGIPSAGVPGLGYAGALWILAIACAPLAVAGATLRAPSR